MAYSIERGEGNTLNQHKKYQLSNITCILLSLVFAIIIDLLGTVVASYMISQEVLNEESYTIIAVITWALSVAAASIFGCVISSEGHLIICGIVTIGNLILLCGMGIVFFDGGFHQIGLGTLSMLTGSGVVIGIKHMVESNKKTKINYKIR